LSTTGSIFDGFAHGVVIGVIFALDILYRIGIELWYGIEVSAFSLGRPIPKPLSWATSNLDMMLTKLF